MFGLGLRALTALFGTTAAVSTGAVVAHNATNGRSTERAVGWAGNKLGDAFNAVIPESLKPFTNGLKDLAQNNPGLTKMAIGAGAALLAYGAISQFTGDDNGQTSSMSKMGTLVAALAVGWVVTQLASSAMQLDKPKPAAAPALSAAPSAS